MSFFTQSQFAMYNLIGMEFWRFLDAKHRTLDDCGGWEDIAPIRDKREHVRVMLRGREFLTKRTGEDFGFSAWEWHHYLVQAPNNGFGYTLWPMPDGADAPWKEIATYLDSPKQQYFEQLAHRVWRCYVARDGKSSHEV